MPDLLIGLWSSIHLSIMTNTMGMNMNTSESKYYVLLLNIDISCVRAWIFWMIVWYSWLYSPSMCDNTNIKYITWIIKPHDVGNNNNFKYQYSNLISTSCDALRIAEALNKHVRNTIVSSTDLPHYSNLGILRHNYLWYWGLELKWGDCEKVSSANRMVFGHTELSTTWSSSLAVLLRPTGLLSTFARSVRLCLPIWWWRHNLSLMPAS